MTPAQRYFDQRNRAIVEALKNGVSRKEIIRAYGLCNARITQICIAAGFRKKPVPSEEQCEKMRRSRLAYLRRTRKEPENPEDLIRFLRRRIVELEAEIDELRGLDS